MCMLIKTLNIYIQNKDIYKKNVINQSMFPVTKCTNKYLKLLHLTLAARPCSLVQEPTKFDADLGVLKFVPFRSHVRNFETGERTVFPAGHIPLFTNYLQLS